MKSKDLILICVIVKLVAHLATSTNYELHIDEFLYYAEGQHLSWGFLEVPPFTPFLAYIAHIFGGSAILLRSFPALFGALTIAVAGLLVLRLGGKQWAVLFTCLSLLVSPSLLGSNMLFQPVSFNQFFWFISAVLLILIVRQRNYKYWYLLGVCLGIGFLNKYSIVFYGLGLFSGILVTGQRKLLLSKYPYLALMIAMGIALPNILWQFNHNFPVIQHMKELQSTQLVHVNWGYFLSSQIMLHFVFSIVWIFGIIGLFRIEKLKQYQFIFWGLLFTVLLIGFFNGKPYYTKGAFTVLYIFGGIAIEKFIKNNILRFAVISALVLLTLPIVPYSLPVLQVEQMKNYCAYMATNFGIKGPLKWEDGSSHEIPQDHAYMTGWEELSQRVSGFYQLLSPDEQKNCIIIGGSYGHASSLNYYRKKYNLPEVYSFDASYPMWLPKRMNFENLIIIEQHPVDTSTWFYENILVDSLRNPLAKERAFIHYRTNPKGDLQTEWRKLVSAAKEEFNLK